MFIHEVRLVVMKLILVAIGITEWIWVKFTHRDDFRASQAHKGSYVHNITSTTADLLSVWPVWNDFSILLEIQENALENVACKLEALSVRNST